MWGCKGKATLPAPLACASRRACGRLESALDDYNKGKITEEKCRLIAEAAKQIAAAYEAKLRQALGS